MKQAIVSDIHGNLEALEAVLQDAAAAGADEVVCLGDVVGYGPNPRECLDRATEFAFTLLGNHEQGVLYDADAYVGGMERSIHWTRQQLEDPAAPGPAERRWRLLAESPRVVNVRGWAYVHGSIRFSLMEYVYPFDVDNHRKLERLFALLDRGSFQGHTHLPGVFTADFTFRTPAELGGRFTLPQRGKVMINVGSVGQPRDGDPRAAYVLYDGAAVEFRRVDYPLEQTIAKIHAVPELDPLFGDRLRSAQ